MCDIFPILDYQQQLGHLLLAPLHREPSADPVLASRMHDCKTLAESWQKLASL